MQNRLSERQQAGNLRALKPEGNLIDFCSNDYLGFARSTELKRLIEQECNTNGVLNGSTGSRLISGNLKYTEELESSIAVSVEAEAALLFNSGYDANIGLLSCLPQRGDTVICDELIHASAIDGVRLSNANRYTFEHNNLDSLESKLKNAKGLCYVVIESVYSMDGDTPPLMELINLTQKYNAHLIVDEAHAFGLFKKGLVAELGLEEHVFARIVTFGKALGCHGAVVVGSAVLRQYLINFARSFVYTTAAPFHQIATIKVAMALLERSENITGALKNNIQLFKTHLNLPAGSMPHSNSAIQCILLNNNDKARTIANALQGAGFDVRPIFSPTVPIGKERIRICLHSFNNEEDIINLAKTINKLYHE
ncbi:aminotransferase class I/II-fold pyridoxal phosphate-dependent enzyme [Mucilaginibacter auburnensis]|uniref:8-amino-7-oxononanoate synthase n=1 Tax=Mucilaginibacter auburnensis TaxID=1457233 RepID=A0A2H9VLB5_9SPHI|nr:8-amino-7-oxononanoate synthase [Mucilaginibacter auburnensis]PJJ79065.1 8-amino-7-oxononanoate synthase [Mucilaginibacter auburnensis]